MITPYHSRAIGQVLTLNDAPLGTGSLIAVEGKTGEVLTARHVVQDHKQVKIRFDKAASQVMTSSEIVLGAHDWALVSVDTPKDVVPLVLYQPPITADTVRWWTIGYASLTAHMRASFHGDVRVVDDDEIELHCIELRSEAASSVADGLSGAPCLIDGGVAGVLTDVLKVRKTNPVAAIYVLPSKIISDESHLGLANGTELPWEDTFTAAVESWPKTACLTAATIAKLGKAFYPPSIIARRMINEGLVTTGRVLQGLNRPPHESKTLIDLASTMWVNGEAAMHMDEVITYDRPAFLATDSDLAAEHHLLRAFACQNSGYPTWAYVYIGDVSGKVGDIVISVEKALRRRLGNVSDSAVDRMVRQDGRSGSPVTVFLHGSPRDELTRRLKERWADLRVIYFIGAIDSQTGALTIDKIKPAHSPAEVKEAEEESTRWQHELDPMKVGDVR